jgi:hypothetical protein
MASDPRVQELLEELLESGDTPEEVCRHSPELLPEVIKRWQRLHACDAQLDALFPSPRTALQLDELTSVELGGELPRIPGNEVQELLGRGARAGVATQTWRVCANRPNWTGCPLANGRTASLCGTRSARCSSAPGRHDRTEGRSGARGDRANLFPE